MASGPPQLSIIPPAHHDDANPRPKKRRRRELVPEPAKDPHAAEVLPEEVVSQLLDRSSAMILKSVGFSGTKAGVQERMRKLMEDYYIQMLHTVGLFALAQRRTRPTVMDFEEMLLQNHISLAGLDDEMERMPSKASSFPLPPPSPPPPPDPDLSELLGPELDGSQDPRCHIHENLPPFPSRHTYQNTPVMPDRPDDPRMIREMATAEARLAEQALRKLLAVTATRKETVQNSNQRIGKKRMEREDEWKRAFDGLSQDTFGKRVPGTKVNGHIESLGSIMNDPVPVSGSKKQDDDGYLEVVVNADNQFWRQGGKGTKRTRTV